MRVFKRTPPRQGAISLGRKIFRFKTHSSKRHFSVHENLACRMSRLFKQRLQKDRKPIKGECSICHEDLNRLDDDITFCRGPCGQNFHENCIEQWTQTHSTCPVCREAWREPSQEPFALDETLDSDGVQLYLDWLYTDRLRVWMHGPTSMEEHGLLLFKAWTVSDVMQDADFRHALIADILENWAILRETSVLRYIFVLKPSPSMTTFVIDTMRTLQHPDQLIERLPYYPIELIQALCGALLRSPRQSIELQDLVDRYTFRTYRVYLPPIPMNNPQGPGTGVSGNGP